MIGDLGIESEEQRQVHVGYELKARMMQCLGHVYPQCTSVVWVVVKLFCFVLFYCIWVEKEHSHFYFNRDGGGVL